MSDVQFGCLAIVAITIAAFYFEKRLSVHSPVADIDAGGDPSAPMPSPRKPKPKAPPRKRMPKPKEAKQDAAQPTRGNAPEAEDPPPVANASSDAA